MCLFLFCLGLNMEEPLLTDPPWVSCAMLTANLSILLVGILNSKTFNYVLLYVFSPCPFPHTLRDVYRTGSYHHLPSHSNAVSLLVVAHRMICIYPKWARNPPPLHSESANPSLLGIFFSGSMTLRGFGLSSPLDIFEQFWTHVFSAHVLRDYRPLKKQNY